MHQENDPRISQIRKKSCNSRRGDPHRFNLSDAVMLKDNHIAVVGLEKA